MGIIGHQKIINLLDRAITKNSVSHAYLFSGPESVGKFTVALDFAKKLIGNPSTDSTSSTSSLQESSPQVVNSDLIIIEPEIEENKGVIKKLDIKVEAIRDLLHKLSLTSTGGKYKVVIIDDADRLNRTAQNALLKTLEEPNEKVILILVCQNEKKLLPTIISRCQKMRFGLVKDLEIEKIVPSSANNKKEMLFWSVGRPGIVVELNSNPAELERRQETLREFNGLFSKNVSEKFALAEAWSKDIGELYKKLKLWLIILRESMLGKNMGAKVSPEAALILIEAISESVKAIKETNSNARLILENLFLKSRRSRPTR